MAKQSLRLFELKKWLTLEDAARHLTLLFGEEVVVADILQLALDGHLVLSINLVNKARAKKGRLVGLEDVPFDVFVPPGAKKTIESIVSSLPKSSRAANEEALVELHRSLIHLPRGIRFTDEEWLVLEKEAEVIDGVWDLPLLGAERLDVEHLYQQETGGPEVTLVNLNGAYLRRDGEICQLQETLRGKTVEVEGRTFVTSDSEIPAAGLPENGVLVVRTASLREFEHSLVSGSGEKGLDARERKTLMCIIGALARAAKVDISEPYKAGGVIEKMLAGQKISARRIGDHLKLVPDAMEDRKV